MINSRDIFWPDLDHDITGDLSGKVAIVTGGGKGIGRAIAENFLKNGLRVVIISRGTGKEWAKGQPNCTHKTCDVRLFSKVKEVVNQVVQEFGALDVLVNAAGYAYLTPVKEESEELFDKIMDTNFKGVRNFMVAAADALEQASGCVINIGSIWGFPGINLPGDSTYSAGDAAIIKYSEVAAEEFESTRVNCISPALVETDMNDDMTPEARAEFAQSYDNRNNLLQPWEIAEVAEYIIKSNINQKNIITDGGYMKNTLGET